MKIEITDDYFINIDEYNHVLKKSGLTEKGAYKEETLGYYPNLRQALGAFVRLQAKNGGDTDLDGFITRLESLSAMYCD